MADQDRIALWDGKCSYISFIYRSVSPLLPSLASKHEQCQMKLSSYPGSSRKEIVLTATRDFITFSNFLMFFYTSEYINQNKIN